MSGAPATPRFGRLGEGDRPAQGAEIFADLLAEGGVRVERIVSRGAASPPGFWYDQGWAEFVLLVAGEAVLGFADGTERRLAPGDWAVLPAGCRHRLAWTDPARETVWLAVHLLPPPPPAPAGVSAPPAA
jgi:cupin 2 domain-containing protein